MFRRIAVGHLAFPNYCHSSTVENSENRAFEHLSDLIRSNFPKKQVGRTKQREGQSLVASVKP